MSRTQLVEMTSRQLQAAALFKKLGLEPADERPILDAFREANHAWRRDRLRRIAAHAQRVRRHLQRYRDRETLLPTFKASMGMPRPVWCVELRRHFRTMSDAARFVNRKASNISQSLARGIRCGGYHWEAYDARRHKSEKARLEA